MSAEAHRFFDIAIQGDDGASLDERVAASVRAMAAEVGVTDRNGKLATVIAGELACDVGKWVFDDLERAGIPVAGKRILDMGAGLGSVSVEGVRRNALPIALEPGRGYREIAWERLRAIGGGAVVGASGEALPFPDATFDIVASVQVLEHVKNPEVYLREAFRVLRPGGHLWLACENYMSFRENHYFVAWFPLLPKPLGALYLRLRGRPTDFLYQSVTYTTPPWVFGMLRRSGFELIDERQMRSRVEAATSGKLALARRLLGPEGATRWLLRLTRGARLFSDGIRILAQKPPAT